MLKTMLISPFFFKLQVNFPNFQWIKKIEPTSEDAYAIVNLFDICYLNWLCTYGENIQTCIYRFSETFYTLIPRRFLYEYFILMIKIDVKSSGDF